MAVLPLNLARVSNNLRSNIALSQINTTETQLTNIQNQLTTGKIVNQPSDNPGSAALIQEIDKTLEKRDAYSSNLDSASTNLAEVDTTLGSVTDLLNQAQTLASANVGDQVTADDRAAAAAQVKSIYDQLLQIGNTSFNGSYIFGGSKQDKAPFVETDGGVQFVGSSKILSNDVDESSQAAFQVDGAQVWGALSSQVESANDLTPAVTTDTRLSDLRGATGNGVTASVITVSNGATSAKVDLSNADTLGDVVDAINNAAVGGVTASLSANGIQLNDAAGEDLTITDSDGGSTAADLGILTQTSPGAGVGVAGIAVKPNITALTKLSDLNGGAGIDLTGFTVTNGGKSKNIDLTSATTVQDMLNAVNGSGTGVQMQVKSDGSGFQLLNATQGPDMSISENGGTTATDLGLRSFSPTTALKDLNGGKGVDVKDGADFSIKDSAGTLFDVDLADTDSTVQDVINKINTASTSAGAGVTASFATTGNGIILTDASGGGGTMAVTAKNDSTAAKDLGIDQPASGGVITGKDVNPVEASGIYANIQKLVTAMNGNDQQGMTAAAEALQGDYQRVVNIHGGVGAQSQAIQSRQSALADSNVSTKALLSKLQDTDFATAAIQYSTLQTALQASMQTTGKILDLSLLNFLS